ncbi:hypothetical protein SASPL_148148 [Salvia splendens]|uniref:Uncharacterized protein n=1 Tax=Salvia splendens TaxID=180675 RepID=A0A8X8WA43_SALSN|nr:hypothetical protein SASPL_148148 [Salvia splendens]
MIKPVGFTQDSWPKLKMDPPRFNGEGVNFCWMRLQMNGLSGGKLTIPTEKGSLESYLADFDPIFRKVSHVGDDTLTSLFVAGLSASLKHELLIRHPASFSDAIALAQQLAGCQTASNSGQSSRARLAWQSLAERADRTRRGLCWCSEPYSRSHVCSKTFYALMGDDADESDCARDIEELITDEEAKNMVISGDVSHILVIGHKLRPRSIRGNCFDIDQFLLQVEGPDVILGVQWL